MTVWLRLLASAPGCASLQEPEGEPELCADLNGPRAEMMMNEREGARLEFQGAKMPHGGEGRGPGGEWARSQSSHRLG